MNENILGASVYCDPGVRCYKWTETKYSAVLWDAYSCNGAPAVPGTTRPGPGRCRQPRRSSQLGYKAQSCVCALRRRVC